MSEIWKNIPHYEDYQASDLGRVRNKHGKILNPWLNGKPQYLKVSLMLSSLTGLGWRERQKHWKVHQIILLTFVGEPEKGQKALHKNDVRTDNRLENLYWGSSKQNVADAIKNGKFFFTHPGFGEKHHGCKFSDETVRKIKSEYTGIRGQQTALAKKYGTSQQHVSAIVLGKLRKKETEYYN